MKASELWNGLFLITVWSNVLILHVPSCRSQLPVPLAARSKAWFRGRSLAGIVGSNSAGGLGCLCVVSVVRYVGRGLGSWPVPGLEESYRVCVCVTGCDQVQQ